MLRIYKVYSFDYYPQKVLTIASSPGLLHSKDDFLSSPTLYVAETTNMVSNKTMRQWNIDHSNQVQSQRFSHVQLILYCLQHWESSFLSHHFISY